MEFLLPHRNVCCSLAEVVDRELVLIMHPFLMWSRRLKYLIFTGAVLLHASIGLLMGLVWFSLTMIGAHAILFDDDEYVRLFAYLRDRVSLSKLLVPLPAGAQVTAANRSAAFSRTSSGSDGPLITTTMSVSGAGARPPG